MLRTVMAAGGLLLLCACQTTAGIPGPTSCNPPARYDHEPKHYYVRTLSPQNLYQVCGRALGCTIKPTIYLRSDLNKTWRACVLRHEKGHINGWPGNHPQ